MWEGSVHTQGTMGLQTPLDAPGPCAPCAERPKGPRNRACSSQSIQTQPVGTLARSRWGSSRQGLSPEKTGAGTSRLTWRHAAPERRPPRCTCHGPGLGPPKPLRHPVGAEPCHGRGSPGPMRPQTQGRPSVPGGRVGLSGGRGGDTSAGHSPFPLEGSFSSKMTRCPSRLDMGAPRSRGSFSPLYRQRRCTESLAQTGTFWTAACGPATENQAVPGSMESHAE